MAVILTIAVPAKGNLDFDFTNQVITAQTGIDILTAQELVNATRDVEEELQALCFDVPSAISGKVTIEGSTASGIIMELLDWFIVSGKASGSFILKNGTIVKTGAGGEVFEANPSVSQINILEVGSTVVTVSSGSGLSTEEHDKLMTGLDTSIPPLVWDEEEAEVVKKMLYNKVVKVGDIATVYEDNGTTVWKQFNLANGGRIEI